MNAIIIISTGEILANLLSIHLKAQVLSPAQSGYIYHWFILPEHKVPD